MTGAPMMPYRVLHDFLPAEGHRALLDWTLANEARFRPAPLAGGIVDTEVRRAQVLRDLGPAEPLLRAAIFARVPQWIDELRVTPFDVTETGGPAPMGSAPCDSAVAWTDTLPDGTLYDSTQTCGDWTDTFGGSSWGKIHDPSSEWTQGCDGSGHDESCSTANALYCFEE